MAAKRGPMFRPLAARASRGLKIANYWTIAQLSLGLLKTVRLLPADKALDFLDNAARRLGPLMGRHRTAMSNLRAAYPENRAALLGESPVTDRHYELPVGSAGVLVGETADRYPVYMPFDDVDVSINLGDARLFTQFVVRSAAAGAVVTLAPQFREFAGYINARVGQIPKVVWPNATTYLGAHAGVGQVMLRQNYIATPRHKQLPIRLINPREESRYQMVLES